MATRKQQPGDGPARPETRPGAWGCLVSSQDEARAARRLGASWLVASHAGLLPGECPAMVKALLPFADANGMVLDMAADIIGEAGSVPVLAAVLTIDQFRQSDHLVAIMAEAGYAGIQTFPSVGILDGGFRILLEDAELGRRQELDSAGRAASRGLYACGVAFHPGETGEAASAGVDMVLVHQPLGDDGGVREWDAGGLAFFEQARLEAEERAAVVAFVPDAGGKIALPRGTLRQFENVACARRNVDNPGGKARSC